MGQRLVQGLLDRGEQVRVLDRPGTHVADPRVDLWHGDVTDPSTLEGLFEGINTVYHLAAVIIARDSQLFDRVNVGGTRNMVQGAMAAGVEHFILASSVSVAYPKSTAYSRSKWECERIVREQTAMKYTIIRPSLAYSEHGGVEFRMFLNYLKRYPVVPFVGRGRALKNPVHVDDLMRGFLAVPGNPKAYGKTYAFTGGEEIPIWDLATLMLRHHGSSKPMIALPASLCTALAWVLERTLSKPQLTWNVVAGITQDANLDNSEARQDLGYNPIGVREGFQRCFPLPEQARSRPAAIVPAGRFLHHLASSVMAKRRQLFGAFVALTAGALLGLAALTRPEVRALGKSSSLFRSLNNPIIRIADTWLFNLRRPVKAPRELGDNRMATAIILNDPMGLAQDSLGNVYIGDRGGGGLDPARSHGRVIWKVDRNGRAHIIAGTGRRGVTSTGGSALESSLGSPESLCVDKLGRVYFADAFNHVVVRIESDGRLTRFAGSGRPGSAGDESPASEAQLNQPYDVSVGPSGDLFIADFGNHRIRQVTSDGLIHTVAGTGEAGYDGDEGPATRARLRGPYGVSAEPGGGFLIGDSFNNVVRRVDDRGIIHTFAGTGRPGYGGDGGPARDAMLDAPQSIYVDRSGRIFIGDEHNHAIRVVDANGVVSSVIGTGVPGFSPDGTPAAEATLNDPENLLILADRSILFSEAGNHRVRLIDREGRLHTFAGGR